MSAHSLHPSSPKGTKPLDPDTDEQVWDAGYEMASYADSRQLGRPIGERTRRSARAMDVVDLFLLALKKDRRLPRKLNEDHPQFWEYFAVFTEGAKAYAKNSGDRFFVR